MQYCIAAQNEYLLPLGEKTKPHKQQLSELIYNLVSRSRNRHIYQLIMFLFSCKYLQIRFLWCHMSAFIRKTQHVSYLPFLDPRSMLQLWCFPIPGAQCEHIFECLKIENEISWHKYSCPLMVLTQCKWQFSIHRCYLCPFNHVLQPCQMPGSRIEFWTILATFRKGFAMNYRSVSVPSLSICHCNSVHCIFRFCY